MKQTFKGKLEIRGYASPDFERILSNDALDFIYQLHKTFNARRQHLLNKRHLRQVELDQGKKPSFLSETSNIRDDKGWKISTIPSDLQKRYVEITGPVERKMIINAMNSGADIFMADFEDSLSPTWTNIIEGQINLLETVRNTISIKSIEGKNYRLNDKTAVLMVRPRGFHLNEKHVCIAEECVSASIFDFGLYFFHNYLHLINKNTAPYFYLPKLESHQEAQLWNDIFVYSQEYVGIPKGTIKATVLIETILAAFEMEEILYVMKDHIVGLNAGRWDYIFSIIKKFQADKGFIFPDRSQIDMNTHFMRTYAQLLVNTCHKRGAHAIGGMAAFIPSRKNLEINPTAIEKVCLDKTREVNDGFDGTWVAHPDLVSIAMNVFSEALKGKPDQKSIIHSDLNNVSEGLLDFTVSEGSITENGVRLNINVTLQYLEHWFRGIGAVALNNLMEDAATAEISRSQLWQWVHHPLGKLPDGKKIDASLLQHFLLQEFEVLTSNQNKNSHKYEEAKKLLENLILQSHFDDFLTIPAYEQLV